MAIKVVLNAARWAAGVGAVAESRNPTGGCGKWKSELFVLVVFRLGSESKGLWAILGAHFGRGGSSRLKIPFLFMLREIWRVCVAEGAIL